MSIEKSVGAVVVNGSGKYLLLRRRDKKSAFWEFPKGHKAAGESDRETLDRELWEECGIRNFNIERGFLGKNRYLNSSGRTRLIVLYLVKVSSDVVRLSGEHSAYTWSPLKSCMKKLNHNSWKGILKDADKRVTSHAIRRVTKTKK